MYVDSPTDCDTSDLIHGTFPTRVSLARRSSPPAGLAPRQSGALIRLVLSRPAPLGVS